LIFSQVFLQRKKIRNKAPTHRFCYKQTARDDDDSLYKYRYVRNEYHQVLVISHFYLLLLLLLFYFVLFYFYFLKGY